MLRLSENDLKKKLKYRETLYNSTALFHVIQGAVRLHPARDMRSKIIAARGLTEMMHLQIFEKLLELGADINGRDEAGCTPLFGCLDTTGNDVTFEMAKLLLARGADPNAQCRVGHTPLTPCAAVGNVQYVKLLLEYGARSDIRVGYIYLTVYPKINQRVTKLYQRRHVA